MQRVRVGVGIGDDREAAGEVESVGIAERVRREIVEADRAVPQAHRADISEAQPCMADAHALSRWAADQAMGQRRHDEAAGRHPIGRNAVRRDQPLQPVEAAMRGAAGREWLVAQFADPPHLTEIVERRRVGLAVEQREIAERAADRRPRPGHAAPRQFHGGDGAACGETHLHRQLRAGLDMRLHRAAALTVINAERVAGLPLVEAGQ